MNAVARQTDFAPSATPEAPRRHRFTLQDLLAIQATGVLGEVRTELVDGEIIDMPSDGELHRRWTVELTRWLATELDLGQYSFAGNTTLDAGDDWAPSPDFQIFPVGLDEADVRGPDLLLVIEQADSSLAGDLGDKALRYARHGVREYWVIDLNARRLHIHREPSPEGYRSVRACEREEAVAALLIPGLTLRLADLPRVG